ncbi:LysR family transcriptional regulator [Ruegeria atlantica]|uniref:Putative hydrogen peroxide-inducible genes activator n=1 Tax=Ruegeria atlantica TaxID=81569 RepID=A0A0N7LQ95_9RHOB|nr:LysR family transcriptional regulator [Ruegeria atlantica]CUH47396.1 putative hydrogen peroxide-inducible genes activator [Ruegeria atlantica]
MLDHRKLSPSLMRSLEVFVAVAETGQMRAGAKLLNLSQPAASQHVTALEKAFGTVLLDRSTRPARLTYAGARLHGRAQKILDALSDMETELRHVGQKSLSLLRVGIQASIATTLTPSLVDFAQREFNVEDITLHAGQSGNHEHLLRTKQADLAITSNPFLDMDGLERHHVLTERYLLVLPEAYDGPTDSLEAIQTRLPLVRFGDTTNAGRQIAQHLRRLRFEPDKVIQADRSSMVTSCVSAGQGFSLLTPTLLIDGLVENMSLQLKDLPVSGLSRTLTVVARKEELQSFPEALADMSRQKLVQRITGHMGDIGAKSVDYDMV